MKYHIHKLNKLQRRAALWITGTFKTSPSKGVKGIAGLIPISLHLRKLSGQSYLRYSTIFSNHAIASLLEHGHTQPSSLHKLALPNLTTKQKAKLKSPIIDIDHHLIQTFPAFTTKPVRIFTPGLCLVDRFPSQFPFFFASDKSDKSKTHHLNTLKNTFSSSLSSPSHTCIIADGGVKNGTITAISHIWHANTRIKRLQMHAMNASSTEAEIMAMRIGLEFALSIEDIKHITLITDSIHAAKKIFDTTIHPYQSLITPLATKIHEFFAKLADHIISIWHYPSNLKWKPHKDVDNDVKSSRVNPIFLSKESWDFSKKTECDNLLLEKIFPHF